MKGKLSKGSKNKKINMTGGAFSDDTMSILLVIIIIAVSFIVAWIIYMQIKPSHKRTKLPDEEYPVKQVIKVVTKNDTESQPPIYPRQNPEYPLQRTPQNYQQVGVCDGLKKEETKKG